MLKVSATEDAAPAAAPQVPAGGYSDAWIWGVCGILLLASSINYMDRQTLSSVSVRITEEFELSNQQYGRLEKVFGWAFAVGALTFGWIADRVNIRWLYPAVLLLWSAMGFLTGWANSFMTLLLCRMLLGFFEAGHWPCALKTTQRLLPPARRTLGNSVLQSGTAIGAILTPLILAEMLTDEPGSWRPAFQAIGLIGAGWVILWFLFIRGGELAPLPMSAVQPGAINFRAAIFNRRFATLLVVVVLINACYHIYRAWLPRFLQIEHGYSEQQMLRFLFWYYIANDVGCLGAGFLTAWLDRHGWSAHWARLVVFSMCASLTGLSILLLFLPSGPGLLTVLLLISMGSLGLFPCYYAFSQEISTRHQGKVTGLLGTSAWLVVSQLHEEFGKWIDATNRYDYGLAIAGLLPLAAVLAIGIGWGPDAPDEPT